MQQARGAIAQSGSPSAMLDARCIVGHVLDKDHSWLMIHDDYLLTDDQLHLINSLVERRCQGEPIAYIIGQRDFWSLTLKCNSSTLIPQPDTETLVEEALKVAPAQGRVLDLATGTGAVALALKAQRPDLKVTGSDYFPEVVQLARDNARLNQLEVNFIQSDWFSEIEGRFDVITANPPYIDENDEHLTQGDVRFEPRSALVAKDHGMADLAFIIAHAGSFLVSGGYLLLEHGYDQRDAVQNLFRQHGYQKVTTIDDLGGNPRVTMGQNF